MFGILPNVTIITMVTSLLTDKFSPQTKPSFQDEYDYVIIGAGAAGSVMASRLSENPCVSVLLLEAGGEPPLLTEIPAFGGFFINSAVDWQYKTVPQRDCAKIQKDNRVQWSSGKALGGSTIINGMIHVRGSHGSYDNWEKEGATGWGYKDVLPYFKKLEDNKNIEDLDKGFHSTGGPLTTARPKYELEIKKPVLEAGKALGIKVVDSNGRRQAGFYDIQATIRDGLRCSTAKAYLVPADNRTNLDILKNAFARKILIRGCKTRGVQFDFGNLTRTVRARKEVIVSAGAVRTPQLLMLSGIGPRDHLRKFNIPCKKDSPVGQNLHEHYGSIILYQLGDSVPPLTVKLLNPLNAARFAANREGPYAAPEQISLYAFLDGLNETSPDMPHLELVWVEVNSEAVKSFVVPEAYEQKFSRYVGKPMYGCVVSLLRSKSRGNVTLSSDDPYENPRIDPNYYSNPEDMEHMIKGVKACDTIAVSEQLKKLGSIPLETVYPGCEGKQGDALIECELRALTLSHWHPVGTARMGNSKDPRSVVDPDLRVLGIQGLRAVDASIMPTVPTGNTYIPTVMIAEKIADKMKKDISCSENLDECH